MFEKGSTDVPEHKGPYTVTGINATIDEENVFGKPLFRRFRFIYFVLLSVLSVIGSLYLFLTLWRKGFFNIKFYLFVGHLCVIYFIFGVFVLPFYIAMFKLEGYWPFGVDLCITFNVVHNICVYEMQVTVVLIAADRLWAMRWPHHYRTHRSFRNIMLTLVLSWAYSCCTVFPTVIHDRLTQSYNVTVCSLAITPNFQYWKSTITMGFLIPSVVVLCIYGAIFYITVVRLCRKRSRISAAATRATNQSMLSRARYKTPVLPFPKGHNGVSSQGAAVTNNNDRDNPPNVPRYHYSSAGNWSRPGDNADQTIGGTLVRINTQREERVLFIMVIVVVNFLVCLLPYAIYCFLWFYHFMHPNRYFFNIGHLLLFSHPVLDIFAFTFTNKELRPSLKWWN